MLYQWSWKLYLLSFLRSLKTEPLFSGSPIGTMFLSPGVTPWKTTLPGVVDGANNPGIRIFEYDTDSLVVKVWKYLALFCMLVIRLYILWAWFLGEWGGVSLHLVPCRRKVILDKPDFITYFNSAIGISPRNKVPKLQSCKVHMREAIKLMTNLLNYTLL